MAKQRLIARIDAEVQRANYHQDACSSAVARIAELEAMLAGLSAKADGLERDREYNADLCRALDAENARLREAIMGIPHGYARRQDRNGLPCWCGAASEENHHDYCVTLREAMDVAQGREVR